MGLSGTSGIMMGIYWEDTGKSPLVVGEYRYINYEWPKMEVPTIYKAYDSGLCKGIHAQNMALSLYGQNMA